MALRILLMLIFASFCLSAKEQEKQRKNIKLLFVPTDVLASLRRNLTIKDFPTGLPADLSGQATRRWTPVRLPGDKTRSFEIRINPRAAHKLNIGFQPFRIGRGHGLLLELKNISLSTKGRTVLDRLVEFYKNCGSVRRLRFGTNRGRWRPLPFPKHALVLPGDVPLLKRIKNTFERFFPKRKDGSVDVFQRKDSNGAVHFLPFDEVRREVSNLIKRNVANRECIKISTNALTRALEAFRKQNGSNENSTTVNYNESSDTDNVDDDSYMHAENHTNKINNTDDKNRNILSFARNLSSLKSLPGNQVNFTSSSVVDVPSDATSTKIVSFLTDLNKEISLLTSGFKKKEHHAIPNSDKKNDDPSNGGRKNEKEARVDTTVNIISNDNSEYKGDEANNRPKMMSSDEGDDKGSKDNNNNNNNNNNNDNSRNNNDSEHTKAFKINTDLDAEKTELGTNSMGVKNNVSQIIPDSSSSVDDSRGHDHSNINIGNVTLDNLFQLVKALNGAKEFKAGSNKFEHAAHAETTKKINKKESSKIGRYRARNKYKHRDRDRVKDKQGRKHPSVAFHYKPKSVRLKMHHKVKNDEDEDDDDDDEEKRKKYRGEGRFVKLVHTRRRKPHIKETMLQDEQEERDKQYNYMQKHFDDFPAKESYAGAENNARLLRKLRLLKHHGHQISRKSPKLRVVVYDDGEEEKEPHKDSWRNSEREKFTEKIHEDDNEAASEPWGKSTDHSTEPLFMDGADNTQQYEQEEIGNGHSERNSDSNMQYLSDSIGADDSSHLGRNSEAGDVPNLVPYLKKTYEDEEGQESDEIKMFNSQDNTLGDMIGKRIGKIPKQYDIAFGEKTNTMVNNEAGEPGRIRIHKLPFNFQEDPYGIDTNVPKEPRHDAMFGPQQIMSPSIMPYMASRPVAMTPTNPAANQHGIDLSPNIVMPPEQPSFIPSIPQMPQMTGGSPMERPNFAAFSGVNYQPTMNSQMNGMIPQMPFPQVSSMMPMQTGAPNVAAFSPMMQPGQIRALIAHGAKTGSKSGVKKTMTPKGSKMKKKHSVILKSLV